MDDTGCKEDVSNLEVYRVKERVDLVGAKLFKAGDGEIKLVDSNLAVDYTEQEVAVNLIHVITNCKCGQNTAPDHSPSFVTLCKDEQDEQSDQPKPNETNHVKIASSHSETHDETSASSNLQNQSHLPCRILTGVEPLRGKVSREGASRSSAVRDGGSPVRSALKFCNSTRLSQVYAGWLHGGGVVWYRELAPGQWLDLNSYEGHTFCAVRIFHRDVAAAAPAARGYQAVSVNGAIMFTAPGINQQRNGEGVVERTEVNITLPVYSLQTRCMQVLLEHAIPNPALIPSLLSHIPTELVLKLWRMYSKHTMFTLFYPK